MARELIPTYYPRQDVQNIDLNQMFALDCAAFRAHNRAFHGCGVVCGLVVTLCDDRFVVRVSPGYALSPQGDEILVPEAVCVAVDCTELIEVDCNDLSPPDAGRGGEFKPAYIAIRYVAKMRRVRLLAPARCAPRECEPTRVCDGYEIVCTTIRPEACLPRVDLAGCAAHPKLLRRLIAVGDLGEAGLFGCAEARTEEWLTLARVDFERDAEGHITPSLSFDERAYVPSTQFILDLARRIGPQALKSQAKRKAITGLGEPPVARLHLNRGADIAALAVHGRELSDAVAVGMSDAAITVGIAANADAHIPLRIHLAIPFATASSVVTLTVTLRSGMAIDSAAQPVSVVIELVDTPLEGIPHLLALGFQERQSMILRLRAVGYTTVQAVAMENAGVLALRYSSHFNANGLRMSFDFAAALISSAQTWLRSGAPGS